MKKNIAILFILLATVKAAVSQNGRLDSMQHQLAISGNDTNKVFALLDICDYYKVIKPDSALVYGYKAISLSRSINFPPGEVHAFVTLSIAQLAVGNYSKAFQYNFQAKEIAEKNKLRYDAVQAVFQKAGLYEKSKDYTKALTLFKEAKRFFDSIHDSQFSAFAQMAIGDIYLKMKQPDTALRIAQLAYDSASKTNGNWVTSYTLLSLGKIYIELKKPDSALSCFNQALSTAYYDVELVCDCYLSIARLYQQKSQTDSSILYGKKSLDLARQSGFYIDAIDASTFLSEVYEKDDIKQSLYYSRQALLYKDSLSNLAQSATQEAFTNFDEQQHQQEIETTKTKFQNRLNIYILLAGSLVLLLVAIGLWRRNIYRKKSFALLQKQKQETDIQKEKAESTLSELKSTQAQLIQSEKMASLGELTAGIAHEIQNPLNFVNNFSEVNKELADEINNENDINEIKAIANDIKENSDKILYHGKRADAIVKGMLQHSRQTSGVKEPTDINALCDEYLRLSYHGLRAKDKNFNAEFKTDFDESIGKINIVPQDIGRVLLNLFNNAFYAVSKKQKTTDAKYKPLVSIQTKKVNNNVEIRVSDNGNGIPQNIIDKIFQPFFTTKPTGQGTGLGLSLAYDIITKEHNGTIKVESKEGEGSVFIINLPA